MDLGVYGTSTGMTGDVMSQVISLSGGALLANLISVVLLVSETLALRR